MATYRRLWCSHSSHRTSSALRGVPRGDSGELEPQELEVGIEELGIVAYNTVELDLEKVFVRRINARVSCVLTS
jgi:hypothetical protein